MAEFELKMKYSTPAARVGMACSGLLLPVWGVIVPITLVLFLIVLLRLPANIPLGYSLLLIVGMLATTALGAAVALVCEDDEIRVSKDGLAFPLGFVYRLKGNLQRNWEELRALKLTWRRGSTFAQDETMTLFFSDGGLVNLRLNLLNPGELEQFFIAFESCAYKCERDAELADFERAVQAKRDGRIYSFTQVWEQTLADRFSSATFTPLEPDTLLQSGRYQVLRQLAFGGFSAVYLARPNDGGYVVLKESSLPQTPDVQSKAAELFEREAALLGKLAHPNIARCLDYFVEGGRHYQVIEHLDGIDLKRLVLQQGPQPESTVRDWVRQLAIVLEYLHEQTPPIVHRDISPDNLLLKPNGTLMLIDFGAAKEIVGGFTGTIIGKQSFMAPEQLKGKPCPKSDIFALGATMFFLLTGKLPEPLSTSTIKDVVTAISDELNDLVQRCTQLESENRPSSTELTNSLTIAEPMPAGLVEAK